MNVRRKICLGGAAVTAACALLLLALPQARDGAGALCNRLFEASEAVNAYAYQRFAVPEGQDVTLASLLLAAGLGGVCAYIAAARSRLPALLMALLLCGAQAYFGLLLPAWAAIPAYALLGFRLMNRPSAWREALPFDAAALLVCLAVALIWPGVDAATEEASERARDRLSRLAQQLTGEAAPAPQERAETRHLNSRSLTAGEEETRRGRDYRLITLKEEQISKPRWIDYLKIALLLLLAAAVLILPFFPFALLNARRKKARERRAAFDSEDTSEAICALFRHAAACLTAAGCGGGNLPYREWTAAINAKLPESYVQRYSGCAKLFEEAAYSSHALDEAQRDEVRALLEETEKLIWTRADWKLKFRLKYVECLCE